MNSSDDLITTCRLCQHYSPEGRRGGHCGRLDVPVLSKWEACSLASHPFETSWLSANDLNTLLYDSVHDNLSITHLDSNELQEINGRSLSLAEY